MKVIVNQLREKLKQILILKKKNLGYIVGKIAVLTTFYFSET